MQQKKKKGGKKGKKSRREEIYKKDEVAIYQVNSSGQTVNRELHEAQFIERLQWYGSLSQNSIAEDAGHRRDCGDQPHSNPFWRRRVVERQEVLGETSEWWDIHVGLGGKVPWPLWVALCYRHVRKALERARIRHPDWRSVGATVNSKQKRSSWNQTPFSNSPHGLPFAMALTDKHWCPFLTDHLKLEIFLIYPDHLLQRGELQAYQVLVISAPKTLCSCINIVI